MEQVFSTASIACMGISAIVTIFGPIALIVIWRKKYQMHLTGVWVGACMFITFALLLESMLHQLVLGMESPVQQFVLNNKAVYVLYAALAAGIFEETGRMVGLKLILKRAKRKEYALSYGIGHGGIECLMIGGFSMINNLLLTTSVNAVGLDMYYSVVPAENMEETKMVIETMAATPAYSYLMGGLERVIAVILQIALSVIVFYAVKRVGKLYLFPVAIGLHAFVDVFAAMYQVGVITNGWLIEGILIVLTAGISYFAYTLYKADTSEECGSDDKVIEPRPIFRKGPEQPKRSMQDMINDVNKK